MIWMFYATIGMVSLAISASAVYALYWSAGAGQFHRIEKGAESIFDEDEPIGVQTDSFPDNRNRDLEHR